MSWKQWVLVVYLLLALLMQIARIGKVRTKADAIAAVPEIGILIWLVVTL